MGFWETEEDEQKRKALSKLKTYELKKLAARKHLDISGYDKEEIIDEIFDAGVSLGMIQRYAGLAKLDKGKKEAKKRRKKMKRIAKKIKIPKARAVKRGIDAKFAELMRTINKRFKPEPAFDERGYESQLFILLNAIYGAKSFQRQVRAKAGTIDILAYRKIALELKVVKTRTTLMHLLGQVEVYKDEFKKIGLILLNPTRMNIDDYLRKFNRIEGVKVVRIPVSMRKQKKKQLRVFKVVK